MPRSVAAKKLFEYVPDPLRRFMSRVPGISHIPGTRQFRRRYQHKISIEAKVHLFRFHNLAILDAATKRRLLRSVRHYVNLLAALDTWRNAVAMGVTIPFIALAVLGLLGTPVITKFWLNVSYSAAGWFGVYYLYMLFLIVAAILLFPWWFLPRRALDYFAPKSLILAWMIFVLVVYIALLRYVGLLPRAEPPDVWTYSAFSGIVGVVLYLVVLLPIFVVVAPIEYGLKRRRNAMHPDAVMVCELLEILWVVELEPAEWTDVRFKQHLISRLEEVAACVQYDLARMMRTRDLATDLWLIGRFEQIAAALRGLKKWVSTPMADTRDQLLTRIADSFVHASAGDWDALARMEVEQISRPEFRSRVLAGVRVLLIALLPMAGLWILQWTPLALDTPASGYARAGVFVWFALTVLAALDPLFGAKLAAFKDVSAVLPLPGKK